jgi:hypothetical protein
MLDPETGEPVILFTDEWYDLVEKYGEPKMRFKNPVTNRAIKLRSRFFNELSITHGVNNLLVK